MNESKYIKKMKAALESFKRFALVLGLMAVLFIITVLISSSLN